MLNRALEPLMGNTKAPVSELLLAFPFERLRGRGGRQRLLQRRTNLWCVMKDVRVLVMIVAEDAIP